MFRLSLLLLMGLLAAPGVMGQEAEEAYAAQLKGEFSTAIELYTSALDSGELSPYGRFKAHVNRGIALSVEGDYQGAVSDFSLGTRDDMGGQR